MPLPIWIERAPANSPVVAALQRAYKWPSLVHFSPAEGYPGIALNADWTEPEQQFNAGRRSDFRRARRNANKMGAFHYEILSPAPAELGPLLEDAFNVEAAGWKGQQGSAVASDTLRAPFYKRYAAYACERGILRLCLLRIGGPMQTTDERFMERAIRAVVHSPAAQGVPDRINMRTRAD